MKTQKGYRVVNVLSSAPGVVDPSLVVVAFFFFFPIFNLTLQKCHWSHRDHLEVICFKFVVPFFTAGSADFSYSTYRPSSRCPPLQKCCHEFITNYTSNIAKTIFLNSLKSSHSSPVSPLR